MRKKWEILMSLIYLQDDIHVVDNLDIPTDEPSFLAG